MAALAVAAPPPASARTGPVIKATTSVVARTTAAPKLPTFSNVRTSTYAIPAGSLFVATNGSDANVGSVTSPVATLKKALAMVRAGQTVVVRGGVYRQGIADPGSAGYPAGTAWTTLPAGVTIQSYPAETVWFDGTDVPTGWRANGSHWSIPWSTPTFCATSYYKTAIGSQTSVGPCSHKDMVTAGTSIGSPQMVFRNGVAVPEVPTLAKLTASTFFYDQAARVLHLGFNPAGSTVEVTKRAQALAIYNTSKLSIKGIGFRRYGSNEYTNATSGALALNKSPNALIERVTMTQNAGGGLLDWASRNLVVRSSILSSNGFNGMSANGVYSQFKTNATIRDDITVEYSRLDGNNTDGFGVGCAASCAAAGAKFAHMVGFTVRGNSFSYNGGRKASGFWCDLACEQGWMYNNSVIGNAAQGLWYEVSNAGTIASNFIANNGGTGLMVGSANTRIYNNTIVNNYNNVLLYDDLRPVGSDVGPNTVNMTFVNNIITGGAVTRPQVTIRGGVATVGGNTAASAFMKTMNNNAYHRPAGTSQWLLNWEERAYVNQLFTTPSALLAARRVGTRDLQVTAAADPFFVSSATSDYRLRPGTAFVGTGSALPVDIATRLGVATAPVNRGDLWVAGAAAAIQPRP